MWVLGPGDPVHLAQLWSRETPRCPGRPPRGCYGHREGLSALSPWGALCPGRGLLTLSHQEPSSY